MILCHLKILKILPQTACGVKAHSLHLRNTDQVMCFQPTEATAPYLGHWTNLQPFIRDYKES